MRLLHARPDLLGGRHARRGPPGRRRTRRRRDPRADERQHLPLRRVREHRPRDQGGRLVNTFEYHAAATIADALKEPGATFLAGGTNLVDLMKLGVPTPIFMFYISQLPLR